MEQHLATYNFALGNDVEVYGVAYEDTPKGEFDSYDLWLAVGGGRECINEGFYIFDWPGWGEVRELLVEYLQSE